MTYPALPHENQLPITAIVGATVIDGTGAPPLTPATVVIRGTRIVTVGRTDHVRVPADATVIDGHGRFVLPGFTDANVHFDSYQFGDTTTTLNPRIVQQARIALRSGVTTVRDSYGPLLPLRMVRDSIRVGRLTGTRLLIAGNIVGYGGSGSITIDGDDARTVRISTPLRESVVQGAGEDLVGLDADSLRVRINQYLDKGVDFVKYGGTVHNNPTGPNFLLFSEHAQRVLIEEAHKRGLRVDTHATSSDGLRAALVAGVDVVQHAEAGGNQYSEDKLRLTDELVQLFVRRHVVCVILASAAADRKKANSTPYRNAEKLIHGGCLVAVATDNRGGEVGPATLQAIQSLVELGMTPMGALVAATRNGAIASGMLSQTGTVEAGKLADLVILNADPLQNIANVAPRHVAMVFKEGTRVDGILDQILDYREKTDKMVREYTSWAGDIVAWPTAQKIAVQKLVSAHSAQEDFLIDSISRNTDKVAGLQRVLQMVTQHMRELRTVLAPAQQATFDLKANAWMQEHAKQPTPVEPKRTN